MMRNLKNYTDQDLRDALAAATLRVNQANHKLAEVRQKREQIEQELDRRRYPAEPGPGSVVRFTRTFGRTAYLYAAARVGTTWYTTAQIDHFSKSSLQWRELVDYVRSQDEGGEMAIEVLGDARQTLRFDK